MSKRHGCRVFQTTTNVCGRIGIGGFQYPDPTAGSGISTCIYIDPNPIDKLNDDGHNYFLSQNPYHLNSYAGFGEVYYNIFEN